MKVIQYTLLTSISLCVSILITGCASTVNTTTKTNTKVTTADTRTFLEENYKKYNILLINRLTSKNYQSAVDIIKSRYDESIRQIDQEDKLFFELNSMENLNSRFFAKFDKIIKDNSSNPYAYLLRGIYIYNQAWRVRGHGYISDTNNIAISEMKRLLKLAISDFNQAIELEPDNYVFYLFLAESANLIGQKDEETYFRKALSLKPESYWVWANYLSTNMPRWGGSYEKVENLINEIKPLIEKNSHLATLQGYILMDKGSLAYIDSKYEKAKTYYQEALKFGDHPNALNTLGLILIETKTDKKQACQYFYRAFKMRPYNFSFNRQISLCRKLELLPKEGEAGGDPIQPTSSNGRLESK